MRNIFLEKSCKECDGETTPRPFPKKQNWVYLWINSLEFYSLFFITYQLEDYWNIMKLSCRPLVRNLYKAFLKKKIGLEKVSLLHFLHFWRKIFFLLYSITWPNFIVWLPLIGKILCNIECRIQTQNDSRQLLWVPEELIIEMS